MRLATIATRNVTARPLSSALTALAIALGVGLSSAILLLHAQLRHGFAQAAFGVDLVVGAKGSPTQLVLNALFHLDRSPGNVPFDHWSQLRAHPAVAAAAPIAVGDSVRGFRVVGTSDAFFREFEPLPGAPFAFAAGGPFRFQERSVERVFGGGTPEAFEAVIGAAAAQATGLEKGETFAPTHGLDEEGDTHGQLWTVVGILAPTGTPADRAIYVNLDSFFAMPDHRGAGRSLSAVLVRARTPAAAVMLRGEVAAWPDTTAAVPAEAVGELFDRLSPIGPILLAVAAAVILAGAVSVLVAIHNTLSERRRPIAIMRALGARRSTILAVVLIEAGLLAAFGAIAGLGLGRLFVAAAAAYLRSEAGVSISTWTASPFEAAVVAGTLLVGLSAGLLPALAAYRTDVAKNLC